MSRTATDDVWRETPRGGVGGFVLLDMALALTLLLILFAVVWPTLGRGTSKARLAATTLDIVNLLRSDRSAATLEGIAKASRIDLEHRTITNAAGRIVAVPDDVRMEIAAGSSCAKGNRLFLIVFAPDGGSCGASLLLKKGSSIFVIRVNWLSGMIDAVDGGKTR
jgi:general secretion pathway protein H